MVLERCKITTFFQTGTLFRQFIFTTRPSETPNRASAIINQKKGKLLPSINSKQCYYEITSDCKDTTFFRIGNLFRQFITLFRQFIFTHRPSETPNRPSAVTNQKRGNFFPPSIMKKPQIKLMGCCKSTTFFRITTLFRQNIFTTR